MRILVTGLDGFTGTYVGQTLKDRGHDVHALTSDLTDPAALHKEVADLAPEAVIHLAAVAFVAHAEIGAFYRINLMGTRHLLEALSEVKALHSVVLASSANIYGNTTEGALSEDHPPHPANDYAVSKLAMEHVAGLFADRLPITIARPFNYTGRGQSDSFLIPKIVAHFKARAPEISLGNIDVARDFGDVRDVAEIYAELVEKAPQGEILNICTGVSTTLSDVIAQCEAITDHQIKIVVNPAFVRANEVKTLTGDPARLHRAIGPRDRIPLKATLGWMLE